jgi:serine/threonine protein kinase
VRLLQSLDHPNIVRYMDSFICENDLMIVYEWAAAGDLKRQLRKAQERGTGFEERVIWKYFSQICNAMQHMHERRIMHRDLKPANIFLTLDGTIKVGDLGLSRELSEHTIQAHSKVGTPLYMSPEVLKGEGYDFKSDIWSLGCLLYELAMLKSPFKSEGLNLYSLFQKISHGDFTPLPENFSEELRNLAYSMISTKSEDRPEIGDVCKVRCAGVLWCFGCWVAGALFNDFCDLMENCLFCALSLTSPHLPAFPSRPRALLTRSPRRCARSRQTRRRTRSPPGQTASIARTAAEPHR